MKDMFFGIIQDVLEDEILYGYGWTKGSNDIPIGKHETGLKQAKDEDDTSYGFTNISRCSGKSMYYKEDYNEKV